MGKVPLAHQVVSLDDLVDVLSPNTNSDTHDHVLGTFSNLAIDSEEVRSLERLETELFCRCMFSLGRHRQSRRSEQCRPTHVVVLEITVVDDGAIEQVLVLHDSLVSLLRDHRCRTSILGVDYTRIHTQTSHQRLRPSLRIEFKTMPHPKCTDRAQRY